MSAHAPAASDGAEPDDGRQPLYASQYRRAIARLIDMTIFFVPSVPVLQMLGPPQTIGDMTTSRSIASAAILSLLWGGYEVALTSLWGRTAGKVIVGITVVRQRDGRPPGPWSSLTRWLLVLVSYVLIPPVALLVLWASSWVDPAKRRQGWHDKVVGTVVIQYRSRIPEKSSLWADFED